MYSKLSHNYVLHCFLIVLVVVCVLQCFCLLKVFLCPCMAINVVSVQYNGGLLPDIIILLTQCYTIGEPV